MEPQLIYILKIVKLEKGWVLSLFEEESYSTKLFTSTEAYLNSILQVRMYIRQIKENSSKMVEGIKLIKDEI